LVSVTTLTASRTDALLADSVRLSAVTRELGIPQCTRQEILNQELVTPLNPVRAGSAVRIGHQDAEYIRQAWTAAVKTGVSVVIVLKVLRALESAVA
jgi:hypothetical protein